MTATCACGAVAFEARGEPIVTSACYCDDCQTGGAQIEALPHAPAVRDTDGGTAYVLFRKDRIACTRGAELLRSYKLKETSATNRVVATCCNSAMVLNFDKGPHWVSAYRARFQGPLPPVEMRVFTKFKPAGVALPKDVPAYSSFAPGLIVRLLAARVAMLFGR